MRHIPTTATAVEKLKRAAKAYRDAKDCPLHEALEAAAVQAGYMSWKHVTQCAADTSCEPACLLPPRHRHMLTWAVLPGQPRPLQAHSVEQLCELLGGIRPYLIRPPCVHAPTGQHCLCELDPFATATQANLALDLGDKHDFWDLLFDRSKPAHEFPGWKMRVYLGLATWDPYPNEHLALRTNRDRSNALNPNNPAHQAAKDNRSMQLNPENWRFGNAGDGKF